MLQDKDRALVSITREGGIGIVEVDNPPVNALSHAVRRGLHQALQQLDSDPDVGGIVICCRGKTFFSGADIAEFDSRPQSPTLSKLIASLEEMTTPTAAAMKGTAFGGGLELALGCRLRVLDANAMVGLPEIKLGLIPGAGGTVRLPRLTGLDYALKVISTGQAVPADEALARGIVHEVAEAEVLEATISHLRSRIEKGVLPPSVSQMNAAPAEDDLRAFERRADELVRKSRGGEASAAAIEAIRNGPAMDLGAAIVQERRLFERLRNSPSSRAQRHLFFAERRAAQLPDIDLREFSPRNIRSVGIVGAGTLGCGIALSFANAGFDVIVREISSEALKAGLQRITDVQGSGIRRGALPTAEAQARLARIRGTVELEDLSGCDLIIEAAFEDLEVKRKIFAELDRSVRPGAILATNTSYLDVNDLASVTARPEDVAGMHFFSPAHVMRLVEVVRAKRTAPGVLASLRAVTRAIGKIPVFVGVCHGFVGNRMLGARNTQIPNLLIEGALPQDIDGAFREFGWSMGPLQMWDMAGLDIAWRNRKFLGESEVIGDDLCAMGRFGQKTGRGYYIYAEGSRAPIPDDEVTSIIGRASRKVGIERRRVFSEEIIERTHYPMINEACRILEEGIAVRASDIDVIWANGYGFPRVLGGPMYWGERLGWRNIVDGCARWHQRTGDDIFKPSNRLVAMSQA